MILAQILMEQGEILSANLNHLERKAFWADLLKNRLDFKVKKIKIHFIYCRFLKKNFIHIFIIAPGPGTYSTFSEFGYFEYKRPESLDVLNKAKSNGKREEKSS